MASPRLTVAYRKVKDGDGNVFLLNLTQLLCNASLVLRIRYDHYIQVETTTVFFKGGVQTYERALYREEGGIKKYIETGKVNIEILRVCFEW